MTVTLFDCLAHSVDPSWLPYVTHGLEKMDSSYLQRLAESKNWLPGAAQIFRAFSLPLDQVNYVLFGESPYPRAASANGYAFWDQAVTQLWSATGLSKEVNRATSLRNIIKMLLIAEGLLSSNHTSQRDIAEIDKHSLVKTNQEFFSNFLKQGILLLNACLVLPLNTEPLHKHARAWQPFMQEILRGLLQRRNHVGFILLGNIAKQVEPWLPQTYGNKICAEHPYNISFITNEHVIRFFAPFHLLQASSH